MQFLARPAESLQPPVPGKIPGSSFLPSFPLSHTSPRAANIQAIVARRLRGKVGRGLGWEDTGECYTLFLRTMDRCGRYTSHPSQSGAAIVPRDYAPHASLRPSRISRDTHAESDWSIDGSYSVVCGRRSGDEKTHPPCRRCSLSTEPSLGPKTETLPGSISLAGDRRVADFIGRGANMGDRSGPRWRRFGPPSGCGEDMRLRQQEGNCNGSASGTALGICDNKKDAWEF